VVVFVLVITFFIAGYSLMLQMFITYNTRLTIIVMYLQMQFFGQIGRIASEEVMLYILKSKINAFLC